MLATILALVMALSLCTSAWATSEGTGESTGATAGAAGNEQTGGAGSGENGTEGGETGSEENGGQTTTYVAQIGETTYETLAAAIKAAKSGATVTLQADTKENVTIDKALTLDLNGFTLNGGTEKGKPALTITARTVTIKDSSEAQTGTIMREDTAENSGVSSHYVIDIQGNAWVIFESGTVKNGSGAGGTKGASLVRVGDDSVKKQPGLVINGGTFTQDNFIVIKVDRGYLKLNGGTLNSAKSYAVENWFSATIKGGTVNGAVSSWTYSSGSNSTLEISGGTVNGAVTSVNYGDADKVAKVEITGGTVTGELDTRSYDPTTGKLTSITDAAKATIKVTGGTFNQSPAKYVVEDSAVTKNSDGTFGVEKAYLAKVGDTSYYTMDEAFHAAVASGETLYLLRDYTTGAEQSSGNKSFAIDLNGKTWTYTGTGTNHAAFEINYSDVTLTVKNGTVVSNSMVGLIPSAMGGTIKYDNAGLVFEDVTMTANGHSGIETNGNNTNDSITLKNSTLNVPNGFGIYFPSSGTLTIDNSKINAKTMGVQVCAGSLEITGDKTAINVTGDPVPKTENDGAIQDGAAISVVDRTGYKGLGKIEVTGGTFKANGTNAAIKAYNWANNTEAEFTAKDNVAVSGGTFSSQVPSEYVAADKRVRVDNANSYTIVTNGGITSGTYTEEPTVAPGYKAVKNDDNTWRVERTSSGGYYYYGPSITAVLNGTNKSATDYPGGDYGLVFRSTAAFSTFQGVQVDGKTLAKSNYTAEEGSIVVYLKAAYLKTLAAGKHTITILSTAGNTSMDFTIGGKSSSPKTFDAGVGIYAVTAVLSMTGMAWTAKKRH